jgi:hypothetical protein
MTRTTSRLTAKSVSIWFKSDKGYAGDTDKLTCPPLFHGVGVLSLALSIAAKFRPRIIG